MQPKTTTSTLTLIDYLFERFTFIWDRKWTDKIDGIEKQKREIWANAIAGMTRKQIDFGIKNASRTLIWPAEIPEFIKLCADKNDVPVSADRIRDIYGYYWPRCAISGCSNAGTTSRDRSDRYICTKHANEGKA